MPTTSRFSGVLQAALLLWVGSYFVSSAHAVENSRIIQFNGQAIPAPASSAAVSSVDGSMTISPMVAGNGLNFPGNASYGITVPGSSTGTTLTITPASTAVPHRLGVSDQRTSSTQYISAKCVNASTLALEACDFSNTTLFPRTFNPPGGGAFYQTAAVQWDSTNQQLVVTTPGPGNQNIQSTGLYIDLPPYVREVTFRATNYGNADAIFGNVLVADAPSVTKAFSSAAIQPGGQSTLTITLKNPDLGAPVPGVNLTDVLPAPLQLVSATHTCTGGTLTGAAGSNTLSLTGSTIPIGGCQITAQVQWPSTSAGINACQSTPSVTNTIMPPAQFNTAIGQMETPATAALSCSYTPPQVSVACVPTELTDSPNQISACTVTSTLAAGTNGLNVNLGLPSSNPRYSTNCTSPLLIAAGATSATCTITATANTVVGDGDAIAALSVAAPSNADDYTVAGDPAQVTVKDDDKSEVATVAPVSALSQWGLVGLASLLTMFSISRLRRRQR